MTNVERSAMLASLDNLEMMTVYAKKLSALVDLIRTMCEALDNPTSGTVVELIESHNAAFEKEHISYG